MPPAGPEGTPFGRYQLIALLGKGGMGQVFRAYDTQANRVVALKVLPAHLARNAGFKERFRREADALARLNNPHVVPIHGFGEIDDQVYVDMQLVDGRELGAILKDTGYGLDQHRAVAIVAQLATALHDAHRVGLVHRDVKPSNVLVTDRDFAYLIDFGLVRASEDAALTATNFAMGTVSYMAPEQLTGVADARSDVYSLACVLYECLTGRQPFTGDLRQKIAAHAAAPPPQPSRVRTGVAPTLDAVIARGMAKDPRMRYQSAPQLAEAARIAVAQHPAPVRDLDPAWQPTQLVATAQFRPPPTARYAPVATTPPQYLTAPRPPWWRHRQAALGAVALAMLLVLAVVVASVLTGCSPSSAPTSPAAAVPLQSGKQSMLPVEGTMSRVLGVDAKDTLYLGGSGLWTLTKGAPKPTQVVLSDHSVPTTMAVTPSGKVYFVTLDGVVEALEPGSTTPERLPFEKMQFFGNIAVARDGTVYLGGVNEVLKLDPGASAPTPLPVTGIKGPGHMVIDADDNLFVSVEGKVVKIAKGATTTEPVEGVTSTPGGLAIDGANNLYVTDRTANTVSRMPAGGGAWAQLPFTGLQTPQAITVDGEGNVYVVSRGRQVVMLAAK